MSKLKSDQWLSKSEDNSKRNMPKFVFSPKTGSRQASRIVRIRDLSKDLKGLRERFKNSQRQEIQERDDEYLELLQLIGDICVGLWRTRLKMIDPNNGEPYEQTMRAFRPLEKTLDTILQAGFEIRDNTNQPYVTGMLEKILTWEQQENLQDATIIETIRPTIVYHQEVLKNGEIIVGVPTKNNVD